MIQGRWGVPVVDWDLDPAEDRVALLVATSPHLQALQVCSLHDGRVLAEEAVQADCVRWADDHRVITASAIRDVIVREHDADTAAVRATSTLAHTERPHCVRLEATADRAHLTVVVTEPSGTVAWGQGAWVLDAGTLEPWVPALPSCAAWRELPGRAWDRLEPERGHWLWAVHAAPDHDPELFLVGIAQRSVTPLGSLGLGRAIGAHTIPSWVAPDRLFVRRPLEVASESGARLGLYSPSDRCWLREERSPAAPGYAALESLQRSARSLDGRRCFGWSWDAKSQQVDAWITRLDDGALPAVRGPRLPGPLRSIAWIGEGVLATVQGRRSLLHVSTWSGAIDSIPPFDRAAAARLVSVSARGRWVLVSTRSGLVGAPTARPGT